jgi:hypothetical protein
VVEVEKNEEKKENISNFSLMDDFETEEVEDSPNQSFIKIQDLAKINHERLFLFHGELENDDVYLIFDSHMIILLKAHPNKLSLGIFKWKKLMKQLKKITFSKKVKDLVSLDFGDFQQELTLKDSQGFFKLIQTIK